MLCALRGTTIADDLCEFECERPPAAQVLGTADAALVFLDAFLDVDSDTGVEAAVGAAKYVQAVVACAQALPPVNASPRTRNAPASMLAPFSGVSA